MTPADLDYHLNLQQSHELLNIICTWDSFSGERWWPVPTRAVWIRALFKDRHRETFSFISIQTKHTREVKLSQFIGLWKIYHIFTFVRYFQMLKANRFNPNEKKNHILNKAVFKLCINHRILPSSSDFWSQQFKPPNTAALLQNSILRLLVPLEKPKLNASAPPRVVSENIQYMYSVQ